MLMHYRAEVSQQSVSAWRNMSWRLREKFIHLQLYSKLYRQKLWVR